MLTVLGDLAEFERELIRTRTSLANGRFISADPNTSWRFRLPSRSKKAPKRGTMLIRRC
jgi:DNA invertase Pin-like site-specific DNA recombinase